MNAADPPTTAVAQPLTESLRPASGDLDLRSVSEIARLLVDDLLDVHTALANCQIAIDEAGRQAEAGFAAGGRLIYVGAGSAGRIAALDASECPPTFGIDPGRVVAIVAGGPAALTTAVEGAEDDTTAGSLAVTTNSVAHPDVVVGISASGTTPYVVAAVETARAAGALTIGITCNERTRLADACDLAIEALVGPELVSGSTRLKAGTAQKTILNALSTAILVRSGLSHGGYMVGVRLHNTKLRQRAASMVAALAHVDLPTAETAVDLAGDVRIAVLMLREQVDATRARAMLDSTEGRLRPHLDSPEDGRA